MIVDFVTWTADPVLFMLGNREVRWYGLLFALGFLFGLHILRKMLCKEGENPEWADSLFIYTLIGTIVGARLGHCLFYEFDYFIHHPIEILFIWNGGLASHGGTLGIVIAIYFFSKKVTHRSPLWTFDRLVVPTGLVAMMIRLGNLFNHEIYGSPTTLPWGFRFVQNLSLWKRGAEPIFCVPSHPTQLYEGGCYLLTFLLMMYLYWYTNARKREGFLLGLFFICIFTSRFFIEFIKNNQEAFEESMWLNMGQLLSIPFVVAGILLIIRSIKKPEVDYSQKKKKSKIY